MDSPYHRIKSLLADPRFISLALVVLGCGLLIAYFGATLRPFLVALVLAYFLDGWVRQFLRWKDNRGLAVGLSFSLFFILYLLAIFGPVQLAARQAIQLARDLPRIAGKVQILMNEAIAGVSDVIPPERREQMVGLATEKLQDWGQFLLESSVATLDSLTSWLFYLVLVPLLVFFFTKDKAELLAALSRLIPKERELIEKVWRETEARIANYVRGKLWEILLVGIVSWVAFLLLGLDYAALMGLVSGLSVVIPFVGVFGAAIPLFFLGHAQWGFQGELWRVMIAFGIIQAIDGYVMVPLVFSEAVKLHPVFILLAIFIFGSLWGFWGVFFAIPLATLAKSLISATLDVLEKPTA